MQTQNYTSDSPVNNKDEDLFSRWQFSERIAQVIARRSDPSSIVIGLYGKWGDGKTSVLNFIESSLQNNEKVICIKFNPWRFGTEEQLLMEFFHTIAQSLDAKLNTREDNLKSTFVKVFKPLASATGTGLVADVVDSFISMPNLDEFKTRTERLLANSKKRVLILIDDVDRLDKDEIHALFRLVKLTADFRFTSYILAFDKDIVASSLQDRYSSADVNSGEAFLEKIIQIPLHLPMVEQETLRRFCFDGIDEALKVSEIELSQDEVQRFLQAYNLAFENQLDTPRKAKLYGNILMFSLPILKGEVNTVDLMLIEGIRVFYPKLYKLVRSNQSLFTGSFSDSSYHNHEHEKEKIKTLIDNALDAVSPLKREGIIGLLKELFPKIQSVYGNIGFGTGYYRIWNEEQKVCSNNYFPRYFTYSVSTNDIPDLTINNIIEEVCNWDCSVISNPLIKIIEDKKPDALITKLQNKQNKLDEQTAKNLAIALCQINDKFLKQEGALIDNFKRSAILLSDIFQTINKHDRVEVIKKCFDNISELEYKIEVFKWLKHEGRENPIDDCLTHQQMNELGKFLAEYIINFIESEGIESLKVSCAKFFWIISKYYNSDYINDFLANNTCNKNILLKLLEDFTPTWTNMVSGKSDKEDFNQEQYLTLIEYVNASIIVDAIENNFGTEIGLLEHYPTKDNEEYSQDPLIYVKQFIWLHRQALSKQKEVVSDNSDTKSP